MYDYKAPAAKAQPVDAQAPMTIEDLILTRLVGLLTNDTTYGFPKKQKKKKKKKKKKPIKYSIGPCS